MECGGSGFETVGAVVDVGSELLAVYVADYFVVADGDAAADAGY